MVMPPMQRVQKNAGIAQSAERPRDAENGPKASVERSDARRIDGEDAGSGPAARVNPCNAPCPKCGSVDILRRFHAKNAQVQCKEFGTPPHPGFQISLSGWQAYAARELILHHCKCCHFEWAGRPLPKLGKGAK